MIGNFYIATQTSWPHTVSNDFAEIHAGDTVVVLDIKPSYYTYKRTLLSAEHGVVYWEGADDIFLEHFVAIKC